MSEKESAGGVTYCTMAHVSFFAYRAVMVTKRATIQGHPDGLAELLTEIGMHLAHKGCLALSTLKGPEHCTKAIFSTGIPHF